MNSAIIVMKSMTEANKAKYYLEQLKIKCVIEKITAKRGGCGYGLRVYDDPEMICRQLSAANIVCVEIRYPHARNRS